MTNPIKVEVNCATGETIETVMSDEEYAEVLIAQEQFALEQAEREAEAQAVADAKASAITKLAKLGLSDAEISALLP